MSKVEINIVEIYRSTKTYSQFFSYLRQIFFAKEFSGVKEEDYESNEQAEHHKGDFH